MVLSEESQSSASLRTRESADDHMGYSASAFAATDASHGRVLPAAYFETGISARLLIMVSTMP